MKQIFRKIFKPVFDNWRQFKGHDKISTEMGGAATSVCDVLLVTNNLQPINIFPDHSKQGNFPNCPILTPVTF